MELQKPTLNVLSKFKEFSESLDRATHTSEVQNKICKDFIVQSDKIMQGLYKDSDELIDSFNECYKIFVEKTTNTSGVKKFFGLGNKAVAEKSKKFEEKLSNLKEEVSNFSDKLYNYEIMNVQADGFLDKYKNEILKPSLESNNDKESNEVNMQTMLSIRDILKSTRTESFKIRDLSKLYISSMENDLANEHNMVEPLKKFNPIAVDTIRRQFNTGLDTDDALDLKIPKK